MLVAERLQDLIAKSHSQDSAVSWPAVRLLGLVSEKHFAQVLAVVEAEHDSDDGDCDVCVVLRDIAATLDSMLSERSPT